MEVKAISPLEILTVVPFHNRVFDFTNSAQITVDLHNFVREVLGVRSVFVIGQCCV